MSSFQHGWSRPYITAYAEKVSRMQPLSKQWESNQSAQRGLKTQQFLRDPSQTPCSDPPSPCTASHDPRGRIPPTYMEPKPGLSLLDLWTESEPTISQKSSRGDPMAQLVWRWSSALTDCRWWFESLLVHSGVSSATRRKATGADTKKKISQKSSRSSEVKDKDIRRVASIVTHHRTPPMPERPFLYALGTPAVQSVPPQVSTLALLAEED